jgi:hypothetical protein
MSEGRCEDLAIDCLNRLGRDIAGVFACPVDEGADQTGLSAIYAEDGQSS